MNYNNGHIQLSPNKESQEKRYKMAKDFSEGNPKLESLLLKLWDNNISTRACCNGHEDRPTIYDEISNNSSKTVIEGPCMWGIIIDIDNNNLTFIDEITSLVQDNLYFDDSLEYDIIYNENGYYISIGSSIKTRDKILEEISACIDIAKKRRNNGIKNDAFYSAHIMKLIAEKNGINIEFRCLSKIEKGNETDSYSFIYSKNSNTISHNSISIQEAIEVLKNKRQIITYRHCSCTFEQLKEYIKTLNPNDRRFQNDSEKKESI